MASRKNAIYISQDGVKVAYQIHALEMIVRLYLLHPALWAPKTVVGEPKLYYEMDLG